MSKEKLADQPTPIVAANIQRIHDLAIGNRTGFIILPLVDPSTGELKDMLDGECDDVNRDMLDATYIGLAIDPGAPFMTRQTEYASGSSERKRVFHSEAADITESTITGTGRMRDQSYTLFRVVVTSLRQL